MKKDFWQLTLVTNKANIPIDTYLKFIEICVEAGITCVQLREKSLNSEELFHFSSSLKYLLDFYNIPLIVNDDIELCKKLGACGVHLGQSDTEITEARSVLGANKIIGLSVNTIEQVQNAQIQSVDYIGVGAIFPTNNKPNVETIWGLSGLNQASLISSLPIVAIGGIDEDNAPIVMNAGANGIAAIGAFHNTKNPFLTTQNLIKIIKQKNNDR